MYQLRFQEDAPQNRSVNQLRGIEASRVKKLYQLFARKYGVEWKGRNYDYTDWDKSDVPNKALSAATSCLYGISEAAILAAGYAPAIGFLHTGKPQSFVYDIADIFKFETVVPIAFEIAAKPKGPIDREVRLRCRDMFRETKILKRLIPLIEEVLSAGGIIPPPAHEEALPVAIPDEKGIADVGHRN
jgi:CRISPR-associated protein Cas1